MIELSSYKPPSKNKLASPIRCINGKCNFETIVIGINNSARSVRIHGIGGTLASKSLFPQCPGTVGSQLREMGMHLRVSARRVPIHHKIIIPASILVASRNEGVTNIRWNRINRDNFVAARAVHCRVPTVYQSYEIVESGLNY